MAWRPTLAYQRFISKHYELNRLYWTQVLGSQALIDKLKEKPEDELTIALVLPEVPKTRHLHSVGETREWTNEYLRRSRLHLLIISAANLETYLKEITFWYTADLGHMDAETLRLTPVGQAIAKPILGRASLPEPLKYAEVFFEVEFGKDLWHWQRYYKLRSAAAHNGGVVTARTLKELPDLKADLHEPLGLEWDELKEALAATERIAKKIDQKVSTRTLRLVEVEKELRGLAAIDKLPEREELWQYIHTQFKLKGLSNQEKRRLLDMLYA